MHRACDVQRIDRSLYTYKSRRGDQAALKQRKRSVKAKLREDRTEATRCNQTWAMDFVHDQLATGKKLRVMTIVDICSRFSPAVDPRYSDRGEDVVATLADLGQRYAMLARWDEAVPLLAESYACNPSQPGSYRIGLFLYHYFHGRYGEALVEARQVNAPQVLYGHVAIAAAAGELGLADQASEAVAAIRTLDPDYGRRVVADLQSRFVKRIGDPVRQWKLSPMDLESYRRWWDYTRAYDEMLRLTDTPHAPWWIVDSNDRKAARLNCITHLLASIPYDKVEYEEPKLGKRQRRPDDHIADHAARNIVPAVS